MEHNIQPQFYYEWGNEPIGYKSVGAYDKNDTYRSCGFMKAEDVKRLNLPFNNPHP